MNIPSCGAQCVAVHNNDLMELKACERTSYQCSIGSSTQRRANCIALRNVQFITVRIYLFLVFEGTGPLKSMLSLSIADVAFI